MGLRKLGKVMFPGAHVLLAGLLGVTVAGPSLAKLTDEEAAQLGIKDTPLTPAGAIRKGNEDGTIPEWTGGVHPDSKYFGPANWPAGYKPGDWYVDPFAADKVLFKITAQNYKQYEDKLPQGAVKLFQLFPDTFYMNIYPTHRAGAYPDRIYESTVQHAKNIQLCPDNKEDRCLDGMPEDGGSLLFPIPKKGIEVLWNSLIPFSPDHWTAPNNAYITHPGGEYTITTVRERLIAPIWWSAEKKKILQGQERFTGNGGAFLCLSQEQIYPPRNAGQIFGSCLYEKLPVNNAYIYLPGQRRVRKAPEIGTWDNPATNSDGLRTTDSARGSWILTGTEERFDVTLHGRKEMFILYNNYRTAQPGLTFKELLHPNHLNPELLRYELHRVWVVEGKLKAGKRHLIPHRIGYYDEDTWMGSSSDMFDAQEQIWRHVQQVTVNMYDVPASGLFWGDAHYDFKVPGRYVGMNSWYNIKEAATPVVPNNAMPDIELFTPQGLRKFGVR